MWVTRGRMPRVAEKADQAQVIEARPEAAAGEGESDPIRAGVHDAAPLDMTSPASAEHARSGPNVRGQGITAENRPGTRCWPATGRASPLLRQVRRPLLAASSVPPTGRGTSMAKNYRVTLTPEERAGLEVMIRRGKAAARKLASQRVAYLDQHSRKGFLLVRLITPGSPRPPEVVDSLARMCGLDVAGRFLRASVRQHRSIEHAFGCVGRSDRRTAATVRRFGRSDRRRGKAPVV